jgi:uncharacterized delta-60 repeat protein
MFSFYKQARKLVTAFVAALTTSVLLFTTVFGADVLLDSSFGTGGKVFTNFASSTDVIHAIALQSDGKIVAAGYARNATDDFAVARYNANGTLDTTFGTGGKVTTAFGSGADQAYGIAIQPDGKIVVTGQARMTTDDFAVARYDTNGTLDATFGTGGKVTTDITSGATDYGRTVAIQSDGKIVVAGSSRSTARKATFDFAIVRYNSNGSLDTTFDSDGKLTVSITSNNDYANVILMQPDGKIVVGGKGEVSKNNYAFALLRVTSTGATDTSFPVTTDMSNRADEIFGLALQSDGKIVTAGVGGAALDFAVARYTAAGALDTTFNTTGKVITNVTTVAANDNARAVAIQSDGKILVAGYSVINGTEDFSIVRYTSAGALDTTFNNAAVAPLKPGVYATAVGTGSDQAFVLALTSSSTVLIGGSAIPTGSTTSDFALVRLYYNNKPVPANDTYSPTEDTVFNSSASSQPNVLSNDTDADGDPMTAALVTNVVHGSLTFNSNGTFTYTPDTNFNGTDIFTYSVSDGKSISITNGTVTLNVEAVNDVPTAANNSYTTPEDTGLTPLQVNAVGGLLGNDFDADGNTLTAILNGAGPSHGSLTLNADGSFNYDPENNWSGTDTFQYHAFDSTADSNVATVTINVGAVNDAPTAIADAYSIIQNGTLTVPAIGDPFNGVLFNDTDPDTGDILTAVKDTNPAHGTLNFHGDGSFEYVPATGYYGPDSFIYHVSDGQLDSAVVTVTIDVVQTNQPPTAAADGTYSGTEDTVLTQAAPGVLSNDTDDGLPSPLTAVVYTNPSYGSVTLNANGSFTYTPNSNFNGTDTFQYRAYDGYHYSTPVTVTLSLNPVNDAPIATADSFITHENIDPFSDSVAINDYDPESDSMTFTLVDDISSGQGTLTFNANGSFDYSPVAVPASPGYYDTSFTYNVTDGLLTSSTVTATIRVYRVNADPVITEGAATSITMSEDGSPIPFSLMLNAADSNDDPINWSIATSASHGTASVASGAGTSKEVSYTPAENYNGSDSFEVKTDDGYGGADYITVNVTIQPVNDAPIADDDVYATDEDTTLIILPADGVLKNDTDPENDSLTATRDSSPASGTLDFHDDGTFSYEPAANYTGPVTFTYHATDGELDSDIVTVTINVGAVNDPPVANDQSISTPEDIVEDITLTALDIDGDTLTYSIVDGPANGTLTGTAPNLTYTPDDGFNGADNFTFKANDGTVDSNIATVSIDVTSVNDIPSIDQADPFAVTMDEDGVFTTTLTATDAEIDPLTWSISSGAANGDASIGASTGLVGYTPDANFNGTDTFTIQVSDGGGTDTIVFEVTVNPLNDTPVAKDDDFDVDEDGFLDITLTQLLSNDTDADDDTLSIASHTDPSSGMLTVNGDDSFTYVPEPDFNGEDSFTYQVSDGSVNSENPATVTITINPVADEPVAVMDSYTVPEDIETSIAADAGVLANDTDADDDVLTAVLDEGPSHAASFTLNANGSFTFDPVDDYTGSDSFTYHAYDGGLASNIVTVTLNINNSNDAPVATDDSYSISEDTDLAVSATTGVLFNDSDADGDTMIAILNQGISNGILALYGNGSFTYTPRANWHGEDTFTYHVTDGLLISDPPVTVTITVNSMPDAPIADNDDYAIDEGISLTVSAAEGVLNGDTDADEGDALTAENAADPAHGNLTFTNDGAFSYTPETNFFGTDTFTYQAYDGSNYSDLATVTIIVRSTNSAPVANDQSVPADEDTAKDITLGGSDLDGDTLTYSVVSDPTNGILSGSVPNVTYTPNPNFSGSDSFTFKANDGTVDSNVATISIEVTSVNDAPSDITLSSSSVNEFLPAGTVVSSLTATDPDTGDSLTFTFCGGPDDASFTLAGNTLSAAASFDTDVKSAYNICIRAADALGATFDKGFIITVNNVYNSMTFSSVKTYDGWILETGEKTNKGGTMNSSATTLFVGDDAANKQYRSFLSFKVTLPAGSTFAFARLDLKYAGKKGTLPFTILKGLMAEMRQPSIGKTIKLEQLDFNATGLKSAGMFSPVPSSTGWYSISLNPALIIKSGTIQFRLRFKLDDNNNKKADYIKFFSGNAPAGSQPKLVIYYK